MDADGQLTTTPEVVAEVIVPIGVLPAILEVLQSTHGAIVKANEESGDSDS